MINTYSPLLSASSSAFAVTAASDGTGLFRVRVTYNLSSASFMKYTTLLPLPNPTIDSSVVVTNGSY